MRTVMNRLSVLPFLVGGMAIAQEADDFEEWQREEQAALQEFKDKDDEEFLNFLKKEWREMQALQGMVQDEVPKPIKMPVATPQPPKYTMSAKSKVVDVPIVKAMPLVKPSLEDRPIPAEVERIKSAKFIFFNMPLTVDYDESVKVVLNGQITKEAISAFWEALSRSNYSGCLAQAQYYKNQLKLNDWGYCQLLNEMSGGIYGGQQNQSNLLVWFMLLKSGYEIKIGYSKDRIYLLFPSENALYGASYFTFEGKKHYMVSFGGRAESIGSLYTYEGRHPGANKLIDFKISVPPDIKTVTIDKIFMVRYGEREHPLSVKLNKEVVDFFSYYPQTDFEVYFGAAPSPETGLSLLSALRPLVTGKMETEAVNILLSFVQTAFDYKTDQEQFGRERSLFPEETLFYPFSDCEDRAILFAYLVRNLLGLEVIGLDYPGHIAAAVKFSSEVEEGDFIIYKNAKYTVCDPTYINASWGMSMPQFKNVVPKVIAAR